MALDIEVIETKSTKSLKQRKVAAYARVSTEKDTMLHSLSAQVSYYSKLIQSNPSWRYCGVYSDNGLTGTKESRPEFQRLLKDCLDGKIDMIITKSISRFSRNTVVLLEKVRMLKDKGIDIYFEEQNIHTMSNEGELMLTLLASFAQAESKSVSDNCKWRIHSAYKEGEQINIRRLFGYHVKKGILTINPDEAKIVQEIFTQYANGTSALELARTLNEQGTTGNWTDRRIRKILHNEKYMGDTLLQKRFVNNHLDKKLITNQGELPQYYVRNSHPAIITRELFAKVQEMLKENRSTFIPKSTEKHVLYDKVVCGLCHKHYIRKKLRGKYFWQCHTYFYEGKDKCPNKKVPEEVLMKIYKKEHKTLQEIVVLGDGRLQVRLNHKTYNKKWSYRPERKKNGTKTSN